MGPLARHSPWRLVRSGVWGALVAAAFLLLAAASAPLFAEAAGNAALAARLRVVPSDAVTADAPVSGWSAARVRPGASWPAVDFEKFPA